jgi:antitoxin MazE
MEQKMQIAKWGNSLAVRIPKKLVEQLNLCEGYDIQLVPAQNGALAVARNHSHIQALANMKHRNWHVPEDFIFHRDEANAR